MESSELNRVDGRKDRTRRKKEKTASYMVKLGCFVTETDREDGSLEVEAECVGGRKPTHLIVMANGIIGRASDWRYAAKQLVKAYPQDVVVHCSKRNHTMLTFDGVDVTGERLAREVISVIDRHPNLQKISFVGHSLGGLICRYAIARLYDPQTCTNSHASSDSGVKGSEDACPAFDGDRIAGLEPMNFITFATPHLGCRGHKQVPMFCGSYAVEKAASAASGILGRTGKHLFLTDKAAGRPPLLVRMVNDCEDLKFFSALKSFKRRVLYANIRSDNVVGWRTSSIRRPNELPERQQLSRNPKYRHIMHIELAKPPSDKEVIPVESNAKRPKTASMEEEMIRGLTKLSWERIDVKFNGILQRILAHNTIQVNNLYIFGKGTDVVAHMIDSFLL
uniref:DUF676 domain-containing protein n=1 Tax=Kalanchoe fedtschenkoi TaxID=63787 RepID=A0A7N0TIH9_KALFE